MQQMDLFKKGSEKDELVKRLQKQPDEKDVTSAPDKKGSEKEVTHRKKDSASRFTEHKTPSKRGRKSFKEINLDVALLEIPDDDVLFQKQYYSITEVAEWFHVNASLLRFWEREFDILKPRKNRKGDRLFRPEDVKNLRIIYYLLRQLKYSIEGAKQFLKDNRKKAEMQTQLVEALTKFRSFLLELRANLGA